MKAVTKGSRSSGPTRKRNKDYTLTRSTPLDVSSGTKCRVNSTLHAVSESSSIWTVRDTAAPRRYGRRSAVCNEYASPEHPLEFVLYDLRHTWCTRMINHGCNIAHLQKLAGHSSINVTQR